MERISPTSAVPTMSRPRALRARPSSFNTGSTMPAETMATASPSKAPGPNDARRAVAEPRESPATSPYHRSLPLRARSLRSSSMPAMNMRYTRPISLSRANHSGWVSTRAWKSTVPYTISSAAEGRRNRRERNGMAAAPATAANNT